MISKPAFNSLVLAAVIIFVACGNSAKDNVCEPGRTVSCACGADVEGTQTCLDDGSGWDVCQCPSSDADVEEDVDMEIDDVAAEDIAAEDLAAEDGVDTSDLDEEEDTVVGPCEPDDGRCAPPSACIGGGCVDPVDDPGAYAAQAALRPSSYWWMVQLPADFDPPESCCFDFTGDGNPDNAYGALVSMFSIIYGDEAVSQELLDAAIEDGTLMRVVDWLELPADGGDGPVRFSIFDAASAQPFSERAAGNGEFRLLPSSFGEYGAHDQFNWGDRTGGQVQAGPSSLTLLLPELLTQTLVPMTIVDAIVTVPVDEQSNGVHSIDESRPGETPELAGGGMLGGVITGESLISFMDDRLGACDCAGFEGLEYYLDSDAGTFILNCTGDIDPLGCGPEDEPYCEDLSIICSTISILPNVFDVDRDADSINESLSIGLRFAWTGATIDGLAPE